VAPGRYLVDQQGHAKYRTDLPIAQKEKKMDLGDADAPKAFTAPQPQLFASIAEGILGGTLEWGMVIFGVLIAVTVELMGISALPFAVGMYIPLPSTAPIFVGGLLRWLADKMRGKPISEAESETSPGVLLSSGYIAGGTLCGLIIAFFTFLPKKFNDELDLTRHLAKLRNLDAFYNSPDSPFPKIAALVAFGILAAVLLMIGSQRSPIDDSQGGDSQRRSEPN